MMFAVLGYQVGNADLQAALATARRHLRPGGLFFCDFWYGPAVLAAAAVRARQSHRLRRTGQMIRVAAGELDARHNLCMVRYHVWRIEDGRVVAEVREQHPMRYFFAPELELLLAAAGFELVRLGAFPEPGRRADRADMERRARRARHLDRSGRHAPLERGGSRLTREPVSAGASASRTSRRRARR